MEALLPISPHVLPLPFFLLAAVRLSSHLLPLDGHYVIKAEAKKSCNDWFKFILIRIPTIEAQESPYSAGGVPCL